ncbi:MAG: YicC family protein [Candidatus Schekmanbacteria bacterium]|nr:YicC family protein [Candidatus Schekmanbacteria bacterium]
MPAPRSMTGFGAAARENDRCRVSVEIKTINHRYLDTAWRLPKQWPDLEAVVRAEIEARMQRGRIEVSVAADAVGSPGVVVTVNEPLARQFAAAIKHLSDGLGLRQDFSVEALLRYPDILAVTAVEAPAETAGVVRELVRAATAEAAEQTVAMRRQEGERLAEDLRGRLARIRQLVVQAEGHAGEVVQKYAERLRKRLGRLLDAVGTTAEALGEEASGRLEMEVAVIADRCDITEELTRARAHLDTLGELLDVPEGTAVGRRMDFLCQELHRELTTMSNKGGSTEISAVGVEARAELEKIREQIQNLE